MKKILHDVSVTISNGMVVYPGDPEPFIEKMMKISGRASANVTHLSFSAHIGTHLDAPYHYDDEGKSIDQFSPDVLVGPCLVCDMGEADVVTEPLLRNFPIPDYERVLFKTRNSRIWKNTRHKFVEDYVYVSSDAAEYLAALDIKIVGIDYLSFDNYHDENSPVHRILLNKGMLFIEGLDLSQIKGGIYELICAPLKIEGADGAPARVFLRETMSGKD